MSAERNLDWQGTWNARDLGGLRTTSGGFTAWHCVVRSDALDKLTSSGWSSVEQYGVTTVLDLRDAAEAEYAPVRAPSTICRVHFPIEEGLDADREFACWRKSGLLATPAYHLRFLDRWPERCLEAVRHVAQAERGGLVVHCGKGCDRTGLVTMLLLDLAGVLHEDIADDFELSRSRLKTERARRLGRADDGERIDAVLRDHGYGDQRSVVVASVASLRTRERLLAAGLSIEVLGAVRSRLLGL